jgi:hypothetical protein
MSQIMFVALVRFQKAIGFEFLDNCLMSLSRAGETSPLPSPWTRRGIFEDEETKPCALAKGASVPGCGILHCADFVLNDDPTCAEVPCSRGSSRTRRGD